MEDYYFYGENKQYNKNSDADNFYFVNEYPRYPNETLSFINIPINDVFTSLKKIVSNSQ